MEITKNRHGCLTTWLIFGIIANAVVILGYLLYGLGIRFFGQAVPNERGWILYISIVLNILNIIFFIALFRWKKWGFWGSVAIGVATVIVNFTSSLGIFSIFGLVGILLLYAVLHIGKENKGWPQLR